MTDRELIELTIRTNIALIKQLNRRPDFEGVIFEKELLARGIYVLQKERELTELDRLNLLFFNRKWSVELVEYGSIR